MDAPPAKKQKLMKTPGHSQPKILSLQDQLAKRNEILKQIYNDQWAERAELNDLTTRVLVSRGYPNTKYPQYHLHEFSKSMAINHDLPKVYKSKIASMIESATNSKTENMTDLTESMPKSTTKSMKESIIESELARLNCARKVQEEYVETPGRMIREQFGIRYLIDRKCEWYNFQLLWNSHVTDQDTLFIKGNISSETYAEVVRELYLERTNFLDSYLDKLLEERVNLEYKKWFATVAPTWKQEKIPNDSLGRERIFVLKMDSWSLDIAQHSSSGVVKAHIARFIPAAQGYRSATSDWIRTACQNSNKIFGSAPEIRGEKPTAGSTRNNDLRVDEEEPNFLIQEADEGEEASDILEEYDPMDFHADALKMEGRRPPRNQPPPSMNNNGLPTLVLGASTDARSDASAQGMPSKQRETSNRRQAQHKLTDAQRAKASPQAMHNADPNRPPQFPKNCGQGDGPFRETSLNSTGTLRGGYMIEASSEGQTTDEDASVEKDIARLTDERLSRRYPTNSLSSSSSISPSTSLQSLGVESETSQSSGAGPTRGYFSGNAVSAEIRTLATPKIQMCRPWVRQQPGDRNLRPVSLPGGLKEVREGGMEREISTTASQATAAEEVQSSSSASPDSGPNAGVTSSTRDGSDTAYTPSSDDSYRELPPSEVRERTANSQSNTSPSRRCSPPPEPRTLMSKAHAQPNSKGTPPDPETQCPVAGCPCNLAHETANIGNADNQDMYLRDGQYVPLGDLQGMEKMSAAPTPALVYENNGYTSADAGSQSRKNGPTNMTSGQGYSTQSYNEKGSQPLPNQQGCQYENFHGTAQMSPNPFQETSTNRLSSPNMRKDVNNDQVTQKSATHHQPWQSSVQPGPGQIVIPSNQVLIYQDRHPRSPQAAQQPACNQLNNNPNYVSKNGQAMNIRGPSRTPQPDHGQEVQNGTPAHTAASDQEYRDGISGTADDTIIISQEHPGSNTGQSSSQGSDGQPRKRSRPTKVKAPKVKVPVGSIDPKTGKLKRKVGRPSKLDKEAEPETLARALAEVEAQGKVPNLLQLQPRVHRQKRQPLSPESPGITAFEKELKEYLLSSRGDWRNAGDDIVFPPSPEPTPPQQQRYTRHPPPIRPKTAIQGLNQRWNVLLDGSLVTGHDEQQDPGNEFRLPPEMEWCGNMNMCELEIREEDDDKVVFANVFFEEEFAAVRGAGGYS
ncbi:hypothetical protein V8E51_002753 [Hyaloscypha variabilis]